MFYEIFRFEFKRAINRPAIYIYWGILFLIAFALINAAGGAIPSINIQFGGDNIFINAPGILDIFMGTFSYLGIFLVAALCANVVLKDYQHNTLELMYSTPLQKVNYLFGRFSAAYLLSILAFTGVGFGFYVGSLMPYLNQAYIGPNEWATYLYPYFTRIIPNVFFVCAIFFSLSILLRNAVVNWISILALYILYAVAMNLFQDLESQNIASLLDPFGIAASLKVSVGNSASDMNDTGAKLENVFLYNRILWVGFGVLLMTLTYFRFQFAYNLRQIKLGKRNNRQSNMASTDENMESTSRELPEVSQKQNTLQSLLQLTRFETNKLFGSAYFWLICLIMLIFLFVASKGIGKMYDTNTYPVTYQVLQIFGGSIQLFIFIIVLLFSGDMIWRDRDKKIHEIFHTYPIPRWVSLSSKFIALTAGMVFINLILILCGVIAQSMAGYYNYELGLYFTSVFGIQFVNTILLMTIAFLIHIVVNNKYIGYVFIVLYWVIDKYFAAIIFKHPLLIYASGTSVSYSDMNGYGFELFPYWIFKFYWLLIAGILIILGNQLLVSQTESHWKTRLSIFKQRVKGNPLKGIATLAIAALLLGSFIFYNTNIKGDYKTPYTKELETVRYEKDFKKYEAIAQPKITDVYLNADLYPEQGNFLAQGIYTMQNLSSSPMEIVYINSNRFIKTLELDRKAKLIASDNDFHIKIYKLEVPLQVNEKLKLKFEFESFNDGFTLSGANNLTQKNGTFLYNSLFPSVGYKVEGELSDKRTREKHDLPKRDIVRSIDDPKGINRHFISNDSHFINFEAVVSTSADQTALTPGKLIKSWKENNRNYFHYQSEHPMINYYAILSGRYEVKTDQWQDENGKTVDLSIYYHKGHEYNLDNMMNGVKVSLDTYTKCYSPYQFDQLRIVEFPRYSSYAQSFPNMIPFSEGIGFIADLRDLNNEDVKDDQKTMDYPFFVTTHEMAHQWWAHQVAAADVEGSQMLMESITQYSALQCMSTYFDKERMNKFFKNEMFRYVSSRKDEQRAERPLAKVAPYQQSTYYKKGALAMNALGNYLGKEKFMNVLSGFLKEYAFKGAPYPTTTDLIDRIKSETPDSLQYFVEDVLEKITLYKTNIDSVTYTRNKDFTYTVDAIIDVEKYYVDGKGEESKTTCNDYIEVAAFNSKNKELYNEKLKLKSGKNKVQFTVKRKPNTLIVDPGYMIVTKDWVRTPKEIGKKKKA
ncbi:ABC transporter permease/M1 family aminopeptidase [Marinifilum flexuosum]|uniref:ABC-2 family transporter n=1 Tax=Marinifilum flexuosum TaxID=1117708 RepID=A0A419WSP1_9BACT|nr:ABC transporter permease subunit [Marinifilum flexuosum]RKD98509.1 ABC-2 family transporter [Marinifilum flexuosum]